MGDIRVGRVPADPPDQWGVPVDADLSQSDGSLLDAYYTMLLIRRFDERCVELTRSGDIVGVVHPCWGQEAVAVGACSALRRTDRIASNHRGHGHTIAKGAGVDRMMAELFGRATGFCQGLGGSLHIADFSVGMVGTNGIVGAGLAITAGSALTSMLHRTDHVSLCFFSDGALGAGPLHETLNLASLWRLPMVFVCENNGWASGNSVADTFAAASIVAVPQSHGVPAESVDGNDVLAVNRAVRAAVQRARAGAGPSFVEAETYRMGPHAISPRPAAPATRNPDELAAWAARDPIERTRDRLVADGRADVAVLERIAADVERVLEGAVDFATAGPVASLDDIVAAFAEGGARL